jgi:GTP-binding protein
VIQTPKTIKIRGAEFLFGVPDIRRIPKQTLPEIAVAGRSNVGKSTFLNRMMGRRIARVSGNPGSTRELNFFKVRGESGEDPFELTLVDMPGFGYAKLPKSERESIARLAVSYIRNRDRLRVVILLNDCRRLPEDDERAVQRMCAESDVRCVVVVTKMDTLKKSEQSRSLAEIAKAYQLESQDLLFTGESLSPQSIWDRLFKLI